MITNFFNNEEFKNEISIEIKKNNTFANLLNTNFVSFPLLGALFNFIVMSN